MVYFKSEIQVFRYSLCKIMHSEKIFEYSIRVNI